MGKGWESILDWNQIYNFLPTTHKIRQVTLSAVRLIFTDLQLGVFWLWFMNLYPICDYMFLSFILDL
jgi:hypothetical protein